MLNSPMWKTSRQDHKVKPNSLYYTRETDKLTEKSLNARMDEYKQQGSKGYRLCIKDEFKQKSSNWDKDTW